MFIVFQSPVNSDINPTRFLIRFGEAAMNITQTFEWFSYFQSGEISVADAKHSCHPSTPVLSIWTTSK